MVDIQSVTEGLKHRVEVFRFRLAAAPVEYRLYSALEACFGDFHTYLLQEDEILEQIRPDTPVQNFEDNLGQVQVFLMQTVHEQFDEVERHAEYLDRMISRQQELPGYHSEVLDKSRETVENLRNESVRFNNLLNSAMQRLDKNEQPGQIAHEINEFEEDEIYDTFDQIERNIDSIEHLLDDNRQMVLGRFILKLKRILPEKGKRNKSSDFSF